MSAVACRGVIDPDADRPLVRQLADLYRARILSGQLPHGARLPAEKRIAQEHDVGVDLVRDALVILRSEGLVETVPRYGSTVRRPERRTVRVQRGSRVRVWMPSPEERREHGLPEGVPLLELTHPSGRVEVFAADEVSLTFA